MRKFLSLGLLLVLSSALSAEMISIPGIGDVGITKEGKKITVSIPKLGTFAGEGYYKSIKDFDLKAIVPAGDFTDYIPVAGQILSILGLDTVSIRVRPNGLGWGLTLESGALGALRGNVTETLSKVKSLKIVIDKLIGSLEIEEFVMEGMIAGKKFSGMVKGRISIIGKKLKFDVDGEISIARVLELIKTKIIDNTVDFVSDAVKVAYKKTKDAAIRIGKAGMGKAKAAWNRVSNYAKATIKTIKYATNSYSNNLKKDLPNYIKAQTQELEKESLALISSIIAEIRPQIEDFPNKEKAELIAEALKPVLADIDAQWNDVKKDKSVEKWSRLGGRKKELLSKYRDGVNAKYNTHIRVRQELINKM